MAKQTQFDKVAAESKSVGFDYQYYFFLLQLLRLRSGEKVGLEVKDDIHIDLANGNLILMQLKHSIRTSSGGAIVNLTERDGDLWKTIKTWINIIGDKAEGRSKVADQLKFVERASFVLVTNKSESAGNLFLSKVSELNSGALSVTEFKTYLGTLITNTVDTDANKDLRAHMQMLHSLTDKVLIAFVSKIQFNLEVDDLITQIKKEIRGFFISDEKIDDVYNALNSTLRDNNYIDVKNRTKLILTHEDFITKYRTCFGRSARLPIRKTEPVLPDDYLSQQFIKQLIDIEDIDATENDQIVAYTKLKLLMFNNLTTWIHKGELTGPQKTAFDEVCLTFWNNEFRAAHQANKRAMKEGKSSVEIENDIKGAANKCLQELRKKVLSIDGDTLDVDLSNGQFYLLNDELKIGWHLDWESKYKTS